jgi:hypothetical protein
MSKSFRCYGITRVSPNNRTIGHPLLRADITGPWHVNVHQLCCTVWTQLENGYVVGMHHIVLRPKYLGLCELDFISNPMGRTRPWHACELWVCDMFVRMATWGCDKCAFVHGEKYTRVIGEKLWAHHKFNKGTTYYQGHVVHLAF